MTKLFTFKKLFLLCLNTMLAVSFFASVMQPLFAQRRMDKLGRGLVAIQQSSGTVFVSWRLLATDPDGIAFNLYRITGSGTEVKLNSSPLTQGTNFTNTGVDITKSNTYFVKPVINSVEQAASGSFTLPANATVKPYIGIPLKSIADGTYYVHHAWPGDLDGNGEYDFVADRLPDGSPSGRTIKLDGYLLDGTFKWQIDLGPNAVISDGHNDGATVYDLDGDGKAEIIVRTSEGTVFGDGTKIGDVNSDGKTDYRVSGVPTGQPQFISVVNGETGAEISRIECKGTGHFGIGYFDGVHPNFLFARVDGSDHKVTTFNYVNKILQTRWEWVWDKVKYQFFHQIRIADIDRDGKDEFCDGAYAIDDDGKTLFTTELGHGDRFHIADIDPDRPGLETFSIQQDNPYFLATVLFDSKTGKMLRRDFLPYSSDIGRGDAGDIDPRYKGIELWTANGDLGTKGSNGDQIYSSKPGICNFAIWWDADLLRETLNRQLVDKWNYASSNMSRLLTAYNWGANYSWRDAPPLYGDFIGDWREEILFETGDHTQLQLFSTTTPTTNRIYTLMQNPSYRLCATVRGYIQSNQLDYFLGDGMVTPPKPPIFDGDLTWTGGMSGNTWDVETSANWKDYSETGSLTYSNGKKVLFDISGNNSTPVNMTGTLSPAALTVNSPVNYEFAGTGSLSGDMMLTKAGTGILTISTNNAYSGATIVNEGVLRLNGNLGQSAVTVQSNAILSGSGTAEKGLTVESKGNVSPGNEAGSAGVLGVKSGAVLKDAAKIYFDLTSDNTGTTKINDKLQIEGDLQLTGTLKLLINPLETLTSGNYDLITYTSAFTGNVSNITVEGLEGIPYSLSNPAGKIVLVVQNVRAASNITWSGAAGSAWDIAKTINWTSNSASDVFVGGDNVLFDDNGSNTSVTLSGKLPVSSLQVSSSKNYTFSGSGSISGTSGLTKAGSGTLSLQTNNTFSGAVNINGGILEVSRLNNGGEAGSLGMSGSAASNLVLSNGGALKINSTLTQNTDRGITLSTGGGEVTVSNAMATLGGVISGSGSLTKTGTGILAVTGKNTYTGGTTIKAGRFQLSSFDANEFGLGTGLVTIENGGILSMLDTWDGDYDYMNTLGPWSMYVPAGATARLNAAGRCRLSGALTGAGTFEMYTPFIRTELNGNWSQFAGTIKILSDTDGGDFRINTSSGYGKATLFLSDNVAAYYLATVSSSGTTLDIGALNGAATSYLKGGATGGRTFTWRVGGINTDATYPGTIAENASSSILAINKTGTGTWSISGVNTYKGNTTVSAGKLLVNNTTGSGTGTGNVSIAANATLGGSGTISGTVTMIAGASIEPGNNAIGTFSLGVNLIITASSKIIAEVNPTNVSSDRLNVAGTLTYGGTLKVTRLGSNPYAVGNSFKLFNAATYAGTVPTIDPIKPADGLLWDTSDLLSTGTLKVVADPLPVTLSNFEAVNNSNSVLVKWTTESELNNDFFTLEHSVNGHNFLSIATVKGKGTSTGRVNYQYPDVNFAQGTNYYRLKQTDLDGKFTYSDVRSVKMDLNASPVSIYPNPFKTELSVSVKNTSGLEDISLMITDLFGRTLFRTNGNNELVNSKLQSFVNQLSTGAYILNVKTDAVAYSSKIYKQ